MIACNFIEFPLYPLIIVHRSIYIYMGIWYTTECPSRHAQIHVGLEHVEYVTFIQTSLSTACSYEEPDT